MPIRDDEDVIAYFLGEHEVYIGEEAEKERGLVLHLLQIRGSFANAFSRLYLYNTAIYV